MFVSRVAVSLRIPGLKKKSLVKITSPVHNCRLVEVYTMDKLVRLLRNFGVVVSNPNCQKNIKGRFGLETEEHKRAVRVGDNNSKVAQHANQFVHSIDFDHATTVDRARSFPKIKTRFDIL